MQNFEGRVAVITGGASGIGLALAKRFGSEGCKVVLGDVQTDALAEAVKQLESLGIEVVGVVTDVVDAASMQALADAATARFGAVHIFCNNAGVGGGGLSWESPLSTWEWVIGVNLWGVIHGIRAFVPLLLQHDEAHIVNTASVAGLVAAPMMGAYNASKHAVVALSETLHHEFALTGTNAKVSVLCPGWVRTNIATSERNRPEDLRDDQETEAQAQGDMAQVLASMIDNGMDPDAVAEGVFQAIRDEQFWVLTHDDNDMWMHAVNARLDSTRNRTNPALNLLG